MSDMFIGTLVPRVTFAFRVGDDEPDEGGCPIGGEFVYQNTDDIFNGQRVIIFSLPGAFTPTCSTFQLPGFEQMYDQFKAKGIDEIYVVSVNDAFVMNAWAKHLGIKNVKVLPDGNGDFTDGMSMLVDKKNLGFGQRSWRYAAVVDDGVITHWFEEPGMMDDAEDDPYGETSPENVMAALSE